MRYLLALCLLLTLLPVHAQWWGDSRSQAKEVSWDTLIKLDVDTGQFPADLAALNGQTIKLPGFVVPLELEGEKLKELLLVPGYGYCIHIPPPPPNQMVHVTLEEPVSFETIGMMGHFSSPVWVTGDLTIADVDSAYGRVGFTILARELSPYQLEP